jgi:hypothetical protein
MHSVFGFCQHTCRLGAAAVLQWRQLPFLLHYKAFLNGSQQPAACGVCPGIDRWLASHLWQLLAAQHAAAGCHPPTHARELLLTRLCCAAHVALQDTVIIGGVEQQQQAQALARRPHVVVATPGRLAALVQADSSLGAGESSRGCPCSAGCSVSLICKLCLPGAASDVCSRL